MKISLLLVSDQPMLCKWLSSVIKPAGYAPCKDITTPADAFTVVRTHRPHLILIDAQFRNNQGFELARQLMLAHPLCRCIALVPLSPDFIEQAFLTDISGYLPSEPDEEEILACLEAVAQRRRYISPVLVAYLKLPVPTVTRSESLLPLLSERERAVLQLFYEGQNAPEIAEQLGIAVSTVNTHKQNMVEKLCLKNRRELMVVAAALFGSSS